MRILLDENLDWRLRRDLPGHQVESVPLLGWAGIQNGELLKKAIESGFEILVTMDYNMRLRLQSDRWEIEEQRMRDEDRKRDIQEMKDHLTGRVCSAIARPTLAKALGGGEAAGKLADYLHEIQYEAFSPNGTGDGPGRVNSGSNSIKPNQTGNIQESARNGPDPTESE